MVAAAPRVEAPAPIAYPPVVAPPRGIGGIVIAATVVELPAVQPAGGVIAKVDLKGLELSRASMQLGALFDNSGKKDPEPVAVPEKKSPAPSKPRATGRPSRPERPVTLPESDLEDEIGISPLLDPR
jgi:hypothetical protein